MDNYRFGFNGQEMDNEISGQTGTHTTAMFWEYDSRLGRRWNLDPKPQIGISDYACFGNNPIWFSDILGDKWDPSNSSQEKADKFRSRTNEQIASTNTEISNISKKMSALDNTSSEYAQLNDQLTNLNTRLGELSDVISELNEMEKSDQVYQLKPTWKDPNASTYSISGGKYVEAGLGGETYYKNGVVVMEYGLGDLNAQAHELKHGFQFEMGLVSFNKATGKAGLLYDLTDEQAAFQRGSAFGEKLSAPLLKISIAELIELGYKSTTPAISLDSKMLIENVLKVHYPKGFEMKAIYDGQTFDKYEEDYVR